MRNIDIRADFLDSLNSLRHFALGRCGIEKAIRGLEIFRMAFASESAEILEIKLLGHISEGLLGRCGIFGMSEILCECFEKQFENLSCRERENIAIHFRSLCADFEKMREDNCLVLFLKNVILGN